jgi:hypothetical protein
LSSDHAVDPQRVTLTVSERGKGYAFLESLNLSRHVDDDDDEKASREYDNKTRLDSLKLIFLKKKKQHRTTSLAERGRKTMPPRGNLSKFD